MSASHGRAAARPRQKWVAPTPPAAAAATTSVGPVGGLHVDANKEDNNQTQHADNSGSATTAAGAPHYVVRKGEQVSTPTSASRSHGSSAFVVPAAAAVTIAPIHAHASPPSPSRSAGGDLDAAFHSLDRELEALTLPRAPDAAVAVAAPPSLSNPAAPLTRATSATRINAVRLHTPGRRDADGVRAALLPVGGSDEAPSSPTGPPKVTIDSSSDAAIELSSITFHASPRARANPTVIIDESPSIVAVPAPQLSPLSSLPPLTPSSTVGPSAGSGPSTPSLLLANGRPNKALISAREAFLKRTSGGGASSLGGHASGGGGSSSGPSLIPGINDSPPRRTRGLSPHPSSGAGKPRSASTVSSPASGPTSPAAPRPPPPATLPRPHSRRSLSMVDPPKRTLGSIFGTLGVGAGRKLKKASFDSAATAGGANSHHIRIVPSAEELNRDGIGIDDPNSGRDEETFKPALKLKQHGSSRTARRRSAAHERIAAKEKRAAAAASAWSWAQVRLSLAKSRPTRPVIGGKLAMRPTLRYVPYARGLFEVHRGLQSIPYQALMALLVLVSIFATDFTFAFLPSSYDGATSLLLFVILLIQAIDIVLNALLHSNYIGCIYSHFDLLSIVSLVVDIVAVDPSDHSGFNSGWDMWTPKHSYYSMVVSSGNDLSFLSQLSCFMKTWRLLRLCRVVNLLTRKLRKQRYEAMEARRCLGGGGTESDTYEGDDGMRGGSPAADPTAWSHPFGPPGPVKQGSFSTTLPTPPPSQLGTILADTVSVRAILLVVVLGCFVPVLISNAFGGIVAADQAAKTSALQHMASTFVSTRGTTVTYQTGTDWPVSTEQATVMPLLYDAFLSAHGGSGGLVGKDNGRAMYFVASLATQPANDTTASFTTTQLALRDWSDSSRAASRPELETQSLSVSSSFSWVTPSSDAVTAVLTLSVVFDSRTALYNAAWLHLLLQLLLLLAFLASTLSLASSLSSLIIHPFERIVGVVWQLTKSLGIVKEAEKYRAKNYGSVQHAGSASVPAKGDGPSPTLAQTVPLHRRLFADLKSTILPCRIRAYELRVVDDLITKLGRIFHVTPASRNALLTTGAAGTVSAGGAHGHAHGGYASAAAAGKHDAHLSKSMRLLTGTRLTEIQTPHTILTVQVSERPLEKELKGVKGTTAPGHRTRVRHYGDHHVRRNSLSSLAGSLLDEHSNIMSMVQWRLAGASGGGAAGEHSISKSATSNNGSAVGSASAQAHSPDRGAAVMSAVQSRIVSGGHALGLDATLPGGRRASMRQANKAAFLLGFSSSKRQLLNPDGHVDDRDHPELASLDALLVQPLALTHFRSFLTTKHSLEIFLFYIQVLQFQQDLLTKAARIEASFIRIGAPHEINIPAEVRAEIGAALCAPGFATFDRAKAEVINLLRGSFQEFMASEAALNYLAQKIRERIVLAPDATNAAALEAANAMH